MKDDEIDGLFDLAMVLLALAVLLAIILAHIKE